MPVYQIVGSLVDVAVDTPTTISLSPDTPNVAGNKNISVLKIDNPDLTTTNGFSFSLTAPIETYDADITTAVAPGATAFVQVASGNYTGPVYVRVSGGSTGMYVQAVSIIG